MTTFLTAVLTPPALALVEALVGQLARQFWIRNARSYRAATAMA